MPKSCGIDGCKSGTASQRKRRKLLGLKPISVFSAPANPSQLEKWNEALSGNNKKLSPHGLVCANHFRPEDIETHYVTELPDGTKHMIERGSYRLKPNAIPINPANKVECIERIAQAPGNPDLATEEVSLSTIVVSANQSDNPTVDLISATDKSTSEDEDRIYTVDGIEMDENNDSYSIDSLVRDLKQATWKEGWVWSNRIHLSSVEFVQMDARNMQPRINCCVNSSMEITISVDGKSAGIEMNDCTLSSFPELMALLDEIENLKICAGTGFESQIRATDCSGIIGDIYEKRCMSQRCPPCRAVRRSIQKRKKVDPDSKYSEVVKKLYALRKRHKVLQETARKLKERYKYSLRMQEPRNKK